MSSEKIKNLKYEIIIDILKKEINKKYEEKVDQLSKTLKLKGFRIGFIPKRVININFGNDINNEIIDNILNEKFLEYIKKNNIDIAEKPHVIKLNDNEDIMSFKLEFDILPKIEINLNNIKICKKLAKISETDVKNEIDRLRFKYSLWKNITTESKNNDLLIFDLYKKNANNLQYILNNEELILDEKPYYIKNLKQYLINKNINTEYTFSMINNNLSVLEKENKNNVYIKIHKIQRKYPSDIDNTFMGKIGFPEQNYNNLNNIIKEKLEFISNYLSEKIMRSDILNNLLDKHDFSIPESLIKNKSDDNENDVIRSIKLKLILSEIKRKFNINVSQTEIQAQINLLSQNNKQKIIYDKSYNNIENEIYIKKIINIIEEKIDISEQFISLENLIKLGDSI